MGLKILKKRRQKVCETQKGAYFCTRNKEVHKNTGAVLKSFAGWPKDYIFAVRLLRKKGCKK
ncbi:hypothetical protein HYN48_12100 [Flavobacterium magnum]|uniref:Uncharacterized protein n=1 Tax=Flavobacterium magnum TaxID=2162713 RepID=A0A2S0RGV1_9FLAO|nr:hypothetical protein HYN48_12100 [Flavobacterium magnum]